MMMSEIQPNELDVSLRRTDPTHRIENFRGRDAQLVIDTNDNYRPIIMDGKTLGGKSKVALTNAYNVFTQRFSVPVADDVTNIADHAVMAKANVKQMVDAAVEDATSFEVINNETDLDSKPHDKKTIYFIES